MAADTTRAESLSPTGKPRSSSAGDVPDDLRRRYYVDGRGGAGLGFYVDATVTRSAFRDLGGRLVADRSDPRTIRDLTAIAQHRGWTIVNARGARAFRREAWLAGHAVGLEVRGYRPTERDLQALDRRLDRRPDRERPAAPQRQQPAETAQATLSLVETVVRSRVATRQDQERILAAARSRLADWLERARSPIGDRTGRPPDVAVEKRRERQR